MNFKQINWYAILMSTLLNVFLMLLFMWFNAEFSKKALLFSILFFPCLGVVLTFKKIKK